MGEKTLKLVNILWFGHRPQNVPRLYDLVQVKNDQIRTAFFFALRNTLVADDLKQATNIAFQVKILGWLLNKLNHCLTKPCSILCVVFSGIFYLKIYLCEWCQESRKLAVEQNSFNKDNPLVENV